MRPVCYEKRTLRKNKETNSWKLKSTITHIENTTISLNYEVKHNKRVKNGNEKTRGSEDQPRRSNIKKVATPEREEKAERSYQKNNTRKFSRAEGHVQMDSSSSAPSLVNENRCPKRAPRGLPRRALRVTTTICAGVDRSCGLCVAPRAQVTSYCNDLCPYLHPCTYYEFHEGKDYLNLLNNRS